MSNLFAMVRPRHQDKDIEAFLQLLEAQGWRIKKSSTYYRIYCPCLDRVHQRSVHLTPSSTNYLKNLTKWVERLHREDS